MKALSLLQPWASLVAIGAKRIESRSWYTPHRGLLAIHASARFPGDCVDLTYHEPFSRVLRAHFGLHAGPSALPLGAVLAIVRVTDCRHTGTDETKPPLWVHDLQPEERAFGDYSPNRYGWTLEMIQRLETPIPAKGALGLWEWEPPRDLAVLLGKYGPQRLSPAGDTGTLDLGLEGEKNP